MNCFLIVFLFVKSVFFDVLLLSDVRENKNVFECLLHLINTPLHVLLISMLMARFAYVYLFYSCYGSIAKTSKTKH